MAYSDRKALYAGSCDRPDKALASPSGSVLPDSVHPLSRQGDYSNKL
ncbi:hypothetical protein LI811_002494 [Salmonella enterica]|nr:hypothetical protein [Salmonella enterica]